MHLRPKDAQRLRQACPDLQDWPQSWHVQLADIAVGQQIVQLLTPFLLHLLDQGLAKATVRRHRDNAPGVHPTTQKPPRGGFLNVVETGAARLLRRAPLHFLTASTALPAASLAAPAASLAAPIASLAAPVATAAASLAAPTASLAAAAAPVAAAAAPEATPAAALAVAAAAEAAASTIGAGAGAATGAGAGAGAGASAFLPQAARATAATREAKTSDLFMCVSSGVMGGTQGKEPQ